jgi:hypothetical protein
MPVHFGAFSDETLPPSYCREWSVLEADDGMTMIFAYPTYGMKRIQGGTGTELIIPGIEQDGLPRADLLSVRMSTYRGRLGSHEVIGVWHFSDEVRRWLNSFLPSRDIRSSMFEGGGYTLETISGEGDIGFLKTKGCTFC